jgi:hypothetical protein
MFREVHREAPAQLLDEETIAELYGRPDENILPELEARLQNLRATSMLIDSNNFFWLGLDGAGLFMADARMNTGDFFVKALGPYTEKDNDAVSDLTKYRYYMNSPFATIDFDREDLLQGRTHYNGAFKKKFNFLPLKTWANKCSTLQDEDWNRIASYIGRTLPIKPILEFIAVLASDPVIFIPGICNSDIPDLARKSNEEGFVAEDDEFIKAHETFVLPTITIGDDVIETYPANHPLSRLNEAQRELPVESTFGF